MCNLKRFHHSEHGGVALLFAIFFIPLIAMVGAGIEYSRALALQTKMQAALDATALMVAQNAPAQSSSQLQSTAAAYFAAAFYDTVATNVSVTATYNSGSKPSVTLTGYGTLPLTIMQAVGQYSVPIKTTAVVSLSGGTRLRVALVLDNSGSMGSSNKITTLKAAVQNLLDDLKQKATNPADAYVSIIPFNSEVNVGTSNSGASWIDWTDWDIANGYCSKNAYDKASCLQRNGNWLADHSTWNGCVTDRGNSTGPSSGNYDTNVTPASSSNSATQFPADQRTDCPTSVLPLTNDWNALSAKVTAMVANGYTNQAIGLAHGWASLIGLGPYPTPPAKDPNYPYIDVVILLSDGMNTIDRWYTDQTSIEYRQQMTCSNLKAANFTVFTIQVNTSGDPTSSVLQSCANPSTGFYLLTSASQLITVFDDISMKLSKLQLSK